MALNALGETSCVPMLEPSTTQPMDMVTPVMAAQLPYAMIGGAAGGGVLLIVVVIIVIVIAVVMFRKIRGPGVEGYSMRTNGKLEM